MSYDPRDGEPVTGEDLKLVLRGMMAANPGPLLEAAREDPELLAFLTGMAQLDTVAGAVDEALDGLEKDKESG